MPRTSLKELKHIAAAAAIFFLIELSYYFQIVFQPLFLLTLLIGTILAFIVHEAAHKLAAQAYGYWAEFRLDPRGALLSLISIALPFKLIAPGAVMIYGHLVTVEDIGKIALAGPLTNIVQTIIFTFLYRITNEPFLAVLGFLLASLNADLSVFNLIPLSVIDGKKILNWSVAAWLLLFAPTLTLWVYIRLPIFQL